MNTIINLNKVRKQKMREEKDARAAASRIAFGEKKSAKARREAEADRAARTLAGHRRDGDDAC
jgi:hypothetical protein